MFEFARGVAVVDGVIAITLVEAIGLLLYRRATGNGIAASALLPNLAAGLCLLLALRAALHDAGGHWIALALAAAGLAHLTDLRVRWRRMGSSAIRRPSSSPPM